MKVWVKTIFLALCTWSLNCTAFGTSGSDKKSPDKSEKSDKKGGDRSENSGKSHDRSGRGKDIFESEQCNGGQSHSDKSEADRDLHDRMSNKYDRSGNERGPDRGGIDKEVKDKLWEKDTKTSGHQKTSYDPLFPKHQGNRLYDSDPTCFSGETLVVMAPDREKVLSGEFFSGASENTWMKPIADVEEGELVWSCNLKTGLCGGKEVRKKKIREVHEHLIRIHIADEVIETTQDHPFFTFSRDTYGNGLFRWRKAIYLDPDSDFLVDIAGNIRGIKKIDSTESDSYEVFNLELSTESNDEARHDSNYFVSEEMIMAHNCNANQ